MEKKHLREIAIYLRQSLDKKESLSIETQEEYCRNSIRPEEKGYNVQVYIDKGYSGKNTKRPELQKMITKISNNKVAKVICYKLDRISRDILDFYTMYKNMEAHNTEFCSVYDSFDTTSPTGRAQMAIVVAFAQLERENIQLRVKDNYYSRIKEDGRWAGGPAPYGYKNGKNGNNKSTLIVNDEEIEAVRFMFNSYANNANTSLYKICNELQRHGFKSRRSNGKFDGASIGRILQNPLYAVADEGLYKYFNLRKITFLNNEEAWTGESSCHIVGKKAGNSNIRKYISLEEQSVYLTNFSGIIDSKTFIRVQERLEKNKQIGRANAPSHLEELAGLIKCSKCGYAVKMYNHPYLACYGNYTLKACDALFKRIKFTEIQDLVSIEIQKVLNNINNDILEKEIENQQLLGEINSLKQELNNLINLAALGSLTAEAVKLSIEERQKKINELELKIFMDERTSDRILTDDTEINYSILETEEKKVIVQELIEKIYLNYEGKIEIVWRI